MSLGDIIQDSNIDTGSLLGGTEPEEKDKE